ncbi:MAG: AdoMet-dependent rRNA methyltransferase spb1 [Caeruleum heppii]|nr:MAG: AdoMet-dependent rRNA methyltransferase spb1 [Caeruleum heppii]
MGFKKETGKNRKDKWYNLAKEKGYRARAAFKLIQLNRKYGFLEKSKVVLDLCAAPGSWCQVAAETMPVNSLIVGVDLAPIKPIPRVITFQSDITTDKCRATIRQHLKSWKADAVLHDGAPNVGTAWVQDAFSQAELVLQSMKLATEFLAEGGTFVTKIFRSKDYNSLLWVFNQLFSKVEATKPPSSRNVSAEIFVVCRGYKAPRRIDPRFLDPRAVFAELADPTPNNEAKVFNPEKKKRKRDGYEEGDYTQFKEAPASEFIQTTDPIAMLGSLNKLSFEQKPNGDVALAALDKLPETNKEVRDCCADLKVLGRKEFRSLLRWRLKAREKFGFPSKQNPIQEAEDAEEVAEIVPMDDELRIEEDLQRLNEQESSRKKRERRRENERKQREITRMQLHMTTPTEIGLEQAGSTGDDAMFALKAVDKAGAIGRVSKGKMAPQKDMGHSRRAGLDREVTGNESENFESNSDGDDLEGQLDSLYDQYQTRRSEADAKFRAKKARKVHDDGDWQGCSDSDRSSEDDLIQDDSDSTSSGDDTEDGGAGLITNYESLDVKTGGITKRAARFFDQDIFKDILGPGELPETATTVDLIAKANDSVDSGVADLEGDVEYLGSSDDTDDITANGLGHGSISSGSRHAPKDDKIYNEEEDAESDVGFEIVRSSAGDEAGDDQRDSRKSGRLDIDIITAEAMTLAQRFATGQVTKQDLMDEGFNKYAFRDKDGLPEWFLDDEGKHSKPHRPITAAAAAAIKEKVRALNARPIKKVREAKDRKKFKAAQRLEKLRKKSAMLVDDENMTEKDKAQSISKLMSRAAKKKPKQQVKLVVAKGGNRGISGRPRGVKGKYKIVDARLKKDVRAEKRLAKKKK